MKRRNIFFGGIYFLALFIIVIILIVRTNVYYKNTDKINSESFLDSTFIEEAHTSIRGVIRIPEKGYISTSAELIYNPQDYKGWKNNGPDISFTKNIYIHKLYDLRYPYILYKHANNDTLIARKDSFYLFFKIKNLE